MARGAGAKPRYSPRVARQAGGLRSKHPPLRGVADAHAAARGGKGVPGVLPRHTPPKPPARLGGAAPGVRYASHPDGRNVPGWVAQAEGSRWPTTLRGPAATEHLRSDRARSRAPGPGCPCRGTAVGGCGLAAGPGVCYGWRAPSRRPGGGLERGRRLAPTRAPPLWSERSERSRRGAQPRGWEGVGPRAVGCGLLLGSRGHPIPFAVTAQQAPCGRCIGRPAGAKRKRASPCGLALFEVRTLSRAALVGAPILYHNLPLLSRPAFQFFGCRYTAGPPCCCPPRCAPAPGRAGGGAAALPLLPGCVPPNEKSP